MTRVSDCLTCQHFDGNEVSKNVCTAFPNGIPNTIAFGKALHRDSIKEDQGITWLPILGFEEVRP